MRPCCHAHGAFVPPTSSACPARESGCGNRGAANDDVVQRLRPQGILGLGRGCNTSTCTLAGRVLTWW